MPNGTRSMSPQVDRVRAAPGAHRLDALNIDPEAAADAYRLRVLAQMPADSSDADRGTVREQLSGGWPAMRQATSI